VQSDRDHRTVEEMRRSGGSFVHALAECAQCADEENLRKIKVVFGDYWRRYDALAQDRFEQERARLVRDRLTEASE